MKPTNLAIVEIEDSVLVTTVARVARGETTITMVRHADLGTGNDAMAKAVRDVAASLPPGLGVHVVLGDRRANHFLLPAPAMEPEDLQGLMAREAARHCNLKGDGEVLVHGRELRRLPDGRRQIAVTALPRGVFDPFAKAFAEASVPVLSLRTVDECLASAAADGKASRPAAIEYANGRARFVVGDGDAPTQSRRFLVAGLDANAPVDPTLLGAQLAMEVPRTMDFLTEQGQALPDLLVVSHRTRLQATDLETFVGDIPRGEIAAPQWRLADGVEAPGLAVLGALRLLAARPQRRSLVDGVTLQMAPPRGRWLVAAAAALWAAGAIAFGLSAQRSLNDHQREEYTAKAETQRLAAAIAALRPAAPSMETDLAPHLQTALATRRPLSRMVADVSNAIPDGCFLRRIEMLPDDTIVIEGCAAADSRGEAMRLLRSFTEALRGLDYLMGRGDADVGDEDGRAGRLRFRLQRKWRTS